MERHVPTAIRPLPGMDSSSRMARWYHAGAFPGPKNSLSDSTVAWITQLDLSIRTNVRGAEPPALANRDAQAGRLQRRLWVLLSRHVICRPQNLKDVLALPENERAEIAARLIESLGE